MPRLTASSRRRLTALVLARVERAQTERHRAIRAMEEAHERQYLQDVGWNRDMRKLKAIVDRINSAHKTEVIISTGYRGNSMPVIPPCPTFDLDPLPLTPENAALQVEIAETTEDVVKLIDTLDAHIETYEAIAERALKNAPPAPERAR